MGFMSDLLRKFGFTSDDRDSELDDDEPERGEEYEEGEEEDDDGTGRFPNPFSRNRKKYSPEPPEPEDDPPRQETNGSAGRREGGNNVIRVEGRLPRQASQYAHCEHMVVVRKIDECREIIEYLVNGESVLLNLENVDPKDSGRVVDLLSGAAFALRGRMIRIAHLAYLLAPENVQIIEADMYAAGRMRYQ